MKKVWKRNSYAIILVILSISLATILSMQSNDSHFIKVTVSEGDSLWKISQQFSGQHSMSNTQFVSWVKNHNNIDEDHIYPGEKIVIPVSDKAPSLTEFASGADK
ncbi:cell division suppressor protein YneA [Neobacillus massiliamazoniensis]|uniref:Peptidoglycan-binding domain-containing protein n=1 Tax=Neobacillus massiliamazoniensis TaxID=1499688 RepID=A0A0U1NQP8_9BACI|nr:LysM peptidoglycan-binding domain-containing protein [Neobacillus massiliamazoniensis]CRK80359.1 peptidoglycan-binding domain-containing protein [Neobacillus massiliamazoniensis]